MVPAPGIPLAQSASLLNSLREKPIFYFFQALCEIHPEIDEFHFATYRRRPGLSDRLKEKLNHADQALRASAEEMSAHGIEFWNAALSLAHRRGALRESFVHTALLHNFSLPERLFSLQRTEVLDNGVAQLVSELNPGEGLLVRSRVRQRSTETGFLPMLDFACPCRMENARAIRRLVSLAGCPEGVLVGSGKSYHFYGFRLLSELDWTRFLAFALLFAPVTDSRWVAHRLLDGESRLKIVDSDSGAIPLIEEVFIDAA